MKNFLLLVLLLLLLLVAVVVLLVLLLLLLLLLLLCCCCCYYCCRSPSTSYFMDHGSVTYSFNISTSDNNMPENRFLAMLMSV